MILKAFDKISKMRVIHKEEEMFSTHELINKCNEIKFKWEKKSKKIKWKLF